MFAYNIYVCFQVLFQCNVKAGQAEQAHSGGFYVDVHIAVFILFVAGNRAENTHALNTVFGGVLALIVAQQEDIFIRCFHYPYFPANIQKIVEN